MRITLIGFMGSGKTTIGKKLAGKLNAPFIDLDIYIEEKNRSSISEIFRQKGEAFFRNLEHQNLLEVIRQEKDFVLSVGGGTPCFDDNLKIINENSKSFYIRLPEKALFERLINARSERPLISNMGNPELQQYIHLKLQEREAFYSKAHSIIEGLDQPVQSILEKIEGLGSI